MKKTITFKSAVLALGLTLAVSTVFAGCGQKQAENESTATATQFKGTITVVGSTSVQPIAQEEADAFSKKNPGVKVDIQGVGSGAGIKATIDGTSDLGSSSRDLTPEEKAKGIKEIVIALDGIAVSVNPKNTVADLTKDQVTKIFLGQIKNWKEVGGADKEIIVVSREAGSGTRGAFEELMKLDKKEGDKTISIVKQDALIAEGNGAVKANIASKENAIGYISLGFIDNTVKGVKIDGVEPTVDNVKAKKYAISRPFLFLSKGEITKPEVKAYVDFILSAEGQQIVSKDYITVK